MTLTALTDKAEINEAMHRLYATLSKGATKPYMVVEWPGQREEWRKPEPVLWHQHLKLWAYLAEGSTNWCCYGVVSPAIAPSQTPVVQINPPVEGRNFRVRGAFARDARGRLFYLHTGGVGGGTIPHSKNQVLKPRPNTRGFIESGFWKGERTLVDWPDGNSRDMNVVGQVNHDSLRLAVSEYVHAALHYRLSILQQHPLTASHIARRTVFLSHSNADGDRQWCDEFVNVLQERRRDVWYDQSSMVPGVLDDQLSKQIAGRDVFVVAVSRNSLNSSYVLQEIDSALTLQGEEGRPRILPVRLDDCPMPPELDQFLRVRGPGDTAMPPSETAREVERMLSNWDSEPESMQAHAGRNQARG